MLEVGTNSYCTVAEADAYFAERYGSTNWSALTTLQKEGLLTMATILLDAYCVFSGTKTDSTQLLEFPRNGSTIVPTSIFTAQFEIANTIETNQGIDTKDESALKKMQVDAIVFEWNTNEKIEQTYYNIIVQSLLAPFCSGYANDTDGVIRC